MTDAPRLLEPQALNHAARRTRITAFETGPTAEGRAYSGLDTRQAPGAPRPGLEQLTQPIHENALGAGRAEAVGAPSLQVDSDAEALRGQLRWATKVAAVELDVGLAAAGTTTAVLEAMVSKVHCGEIVMLGSS